jgi:hypothetical protein
VKTRTAAIIPIPEGHTRRFVAAVVLVLGLLAILAGRDLPSASADATGFRSPTAQAVATGGDGDGYETNPANAFTDANGEAEDRDSGTNGTLSCTDPGKDRHVYYNYGFPVPAGAQINGIEVRVDARLDAASGYICAELSWDGGASWTTAKQTSNLSTAFAIYTVGGAADIWGRAWSAGDFSNANFRVRLVNVANNAGARFRLDWVSAQVHYTPAAPDTIGPVTSNVAAAAGGGPIITLTATVDDTAAGNSNLATAEYFIDSLGADASGTAMAAVDGAFDSPSEAVTTAVDLSGQPAGNHTLYVHGRDAAGNWGAAGSVVVAVTTGGGSAVQATIILVAGTLSLDTYDILFPSVSLDGLDQTVDASPVPWRVLDARGTGAGWNVTVTSSDFSSASGSIPVANFKLQLQQSKITTISGNAPPQTQVASYQAFSGVTPTKILAAATGSGMGSYDFTPDFRLTVPSSTVPGDYRASLVVSVNSGP